MSHRRLEHVAMLNHPVPRPHIHNTNPDKNPRGQSIESPQRDERLAVIPVERVDHAHPNRHPDRGDDRKHAAHDRLAGECAAWEQRDPSAERQPLEELVEDDHDEEGLVEGVARYDERDADQDAVEDDSGFHDQDGQLGVGVCGVAAVVVAEAGEGAVLGWVCLFSRGFGGVGGVVGWLGAGRAG